MPHHTYLPGLGLWRPVERKGSLYPAIDATEGHHPLGGAADGEGDHGGVGERRLVGALLRGVVQLLAAAVFRFGVRVLVRGESAAFTIATVLQTREVGTWYVCVWRMKNTNLT